MAAFTDYKALDFSGLDKSINSIAQRQQLSKLGQGLDGTPEGYAKAGQSLLALGDVQGAQNFFALGEKARERSANEAAIKTSPFNSGTFGAPRSPVAPALSALGTPVVAAPKQGVHVAESEEDVQRLERATGMVTTDADRQAIVKTVYGEAANEPAVGQQAVAAVIRNRANQAGLTPEQITQQRNQFEPWNTEAGRARMNGIGQQRFEQIAGTVAPVIDQGLDPTGGATHFYAPRAQAALGRNVPKWDDGTGNDIGNHRFFQLGYGQGGGTPAPSPQSIIASAPQGAPVQMAQAGGDAPVADMPAQGAAPVQAQFAIPGPNQLPPNDPRPDISTPQLLEVLANPRLASQHAIAKTILDGRQRYSDENAPDKRALTQAQAKKAELEVRKLERELAGEGARPMTPDERAAYSVPEGQPAYMNSRGEPKFGPASTKITNSIGAVEGEYAKANGKAISERFSKIVDEGDAAQQEAGAIARLKELGGSIKNMGAGAALQARLAEYGVKVGENVSEIEAYNALIDKLTPQQRLAGSGATSDFDAKMFKNSLPGLIRTPQGNALIIETMEALNIYKRQRADIVSEAMALNEKPADVVKRLKELPDPFAAFKEARKGATGDAQPPARAAPTPVAVPPPQRPAAGTPRTATNPNTGERIMLTPDGQWVPYS